MGTKYLFIHLFSEKLFEDKLFCIKILFRVLFLNFLPYEHFNQSLKAICILFRKSGRYRIKQINKYLDRLFWLIFKRFFRDYFNWYSRLVWQYSLTKFIIRFSCWFHERFWTVWDGNVTITFQNPPACLKSKQTYYPNVRLHKYSLKKRIRKNFFMCK